MIIHAEGFDDGQLRQSGVGNNPATVTTNAVRTGTRGIRITTSTNGNWGGYLVNHANLVTGFVYFAFRAGSLPGGTISICDLLDNGTVHLQIRLRNDGKFDIARNGTSLGVGTFVYTAGSFVHLGFKYTINDATGVAELRVNGSGTPDINLSSQDTRNGANAQVNQTRIGQLTTGINTTGQNWDFDDLVIQDTTGNAPENGFLPDIECRYLFPSGAGDDSDFSVNGSSPAATDWQSVNEVPANDGVTVLRSSTVNHKTTLAFEDLVNTVSTIYAVVGILRAAKGSAGTREMRQVAKLGATEVTGDLHTLSTSWLGYQTVWHDDPDGNAWTGSNVNAAKFGLKLVT